MHFNTKQRLDLLLIHALAAALKMPLFSAKTFFQVIGRGPESKMKKAVTLLGSIFPEFVKLSENILYLFYFLSR